MCNATVSAKKISLEYQAMLEIESIAEELSPRYYINAYTFPKLYVIKQENTRLISTAHWGLIPSFVNDWDRANEIKTQTINAKSETVFDKVSFKKSILAARCLILVDGFFEYQHRSKDKIPYYIYPNESPHFLFGGVYNNWLNHSTGEEISSCSIITTEANPLMCDIHNSKKRMPLIFDQEQAQRWLLRDLHESDIRSLMVKYPEEKMRAHQINKALIMPKQINVENSMIINSYVDPLDRQQLLF